MYVDTHKDNQIDTNISFSVFSLVCLKQCLIPVFNTDNILLNIDKGTFLIHRVK